VVGAALLAGMAAACSGVLLYRRRRQVPVPAAEPVRLQLVPRTADDEERVAA
jgi:hypothetical protein